MRPQIGLKITPMRKLRQRQLLEPCPARRWKPPVLIFQRRGLLWVDPQSLTRIGPKSPYDDSLNKTAKERNQGPCANLKMGKPRRTLGHMKKRRK